MGKRLVKVALLMVVAVVALVAVAIWRPEWFSGSSDNTFETPKGDIILRYSKDGDLTGAIPSTEAERNNVKIVVTFDNGTKKTCGGSCSTDLPVSKLEAKVGGKVIATLTP